MSFVKKAVKKVFKVVKKIVKSDIFKWVVVAAAIFFTAGIAAGGFAAFSGVSSVGGFFTAVGQTIATGASSIASMVGLSGASSSLAAYGGAAAEAAGLTAAATPLVTAAGTITPAVSTGIKVGTAANQAASIAAANAGIVNGSGGIAGTISKLLGKKVLGDVTTGQLIAQGVASGFAAMISGKQNEKEFPNGYVAGDLARGGSSEAPPPITFESGDAPQITAAEPAAETGLRAPAAAPSRAASYSTPESQNVAYDQYSPAYDPNAPGAEYAPLSAPSRISQRLVAEGLVSNYDPRVPEEQAPNNGYIAPVRLDDRATNLRGLLGVG